ncbi:MAG: PAS domain S-box protein, partial [Nitrospiria bacterium]
MKERRRFEIYLEEFQKEKNILREMVAGNETLISRFADLDPAITALSQEAEAVFVAAARREESRLAGASEGEIRRFETGAAAAMARMDRKTRTARQLLQGIHSHLLSNQRHVASSIRGAFYQVTALAAVTLLSSLSWLFFLRRSIVQRRRAVSFRKYVTDVFASVPPGMLVLSGNLHILSASPSFRAMMGEPDADLRGQSLEEILQVADLGEQASEVLATGKPKKNIVVELPVLKRDKFLRAAITPIHPTDADDRARLLLMVEDITELKEAESRTQAILETAPDGVVVADVVEKILWVNPAAERMFGWKAEMLIGQSLRKLMPVSYHKRHAEVVLDFLRRGSSAQFGKPRRLEGLRSDGRTFPMEAVLSKFRRKKSWIFTAFLRDKTEEEMAEKEIERAYEDLKETQGQLVQSEKMASIGQLAAGVAHEINNPVGFVNSNLGRMKEYTNDLFHLLRAYESLLDVLEKGDAAVVAGEAKRVRGVADQVQGEFIMKDLPILLGESMEGLDRVRQIVLNLKEFSHVGKAKRKVSDLNNGL